KRPRRALWPQPSPHPRATGRPRHPDATGQRPDAPRRAWRPVDAAVQQPDQPCRAPTDPHPNGRQQNPALPSPQPPATGDTPPTRKSNRLSTMTTSEHHEYDMMQELPFEKGFRRPRPPERQTPMTHDGPVWGSSSLSSSIPLFTRTPPPMSHRGSTLGD